MNSKTRRRIARQQRDEMDLAAIVLGASLLSDNEHVQDQIENELMAVFCPDDYESDFEDDIPEDDLF